MSCADRRDEASRDPPETARLRALVELVPDLRMMAPVRKALMEASHARDGNEWSRARSYATLDGRVLDPAALERAVREISQAEAVRTRRTLEAVGRALVSLAERDVAAGVDELVREARELMESERHDEAAAFLDVALGELARSESPRREALVRRLLAKACWRLGRLDRAASLYARAADRFRELGDPAGEIVCFQGLGNVRAAQGRWGQAEQAHREALARCGSGESDHVRRAQTYNNLSQVARRRGKLDEAASWQRRAEEAWRTMDASRDRVVAYNNAGLLHLARENLEEARQSFLDGLARAKRDRDRSALLLNLARAEYELGGLGKAESVAREAEELGVLAGADDLLIEIYGLLGMIFRERDDANAVVLFEKALELARETSYSLLRARTHLEYGRFRRRAGDEVEARAHFVEARDIAAGLGAEVELAEIREELDRREPRR